MGLSALLAHLAGGLGLFLLGMTMMTEGLKLGAGSALERILSGATRTRWRALGSGVLVTALVQSSSAVTVAAIGFVNAGLLGLSGALWVLFGANVGTTTTGWVVALLGLKFEIQVLALPLIGLGVLLRLSSARQLRVALGSTLAGFGLLFLGIALLQESFTGLAETVRVPQGEGVAELIAQVGIGALMTVLMQSSSASMTIALTAAQGGIISLPGAAAIVVGANLGTTVTASLAAIGATPNARRAAAAHVIFNALTGVVALSMLPWMIGAITASWRALGLPADPAMNLALFHTSFNLLGVILMWPLSDSLTRWLRARFRAREEDEGSPQFLDDTVLPVPALAVDALDQETRRIGAVSRRLLRAALTSVEPQQRSEDQAIVHRLASVAAKFVERMNRSAMSAASSAQLADVLRTLRYHEACAEQAVLAAELDNRPLAGTDVQTAAALFASVSVAMIDGIDAGSVTDLPDQLKRIDHSYGLLKARLLAAGAGGILRLAAMEESLRRYSALRRALQQAAKATQPRKQSEQYGGARSRAPDAVDGAAMPGEDRAGS